MSPKNLIIRWFPGLSFPLLGKELVELAARPRTYVVRVVYALLLFGFFFEYSSDYLGWSAGSLSMFQVMGGGATMFRILVNLQCAGIFLFLPALMCGVITQEKERDSLVLLFLTDLRPWEVLLQKYLAGLVPMLTFLLLSLPLGAIAYAFGGVSLPEVAGSVIMLLFARLQVGAMAIMFSAYCRTTVSALLCSYFFGAGFYLFIPMLFGWNEWPFLGGNTLGPFFVFRCIPILFWIILFLGFARDFLFSRAFAPPRQVLLKMLRELDGWFKELNAVTGGISFGKEKSGLPENEPVSWRELARKPMGTVRYLVRMCMPVEFVVVFLGLIFATDASAYRDSRGFPFMVATLWLLSIVAVCVQAANVVVSERVYQTLDVLLTTPLSAREIVRQKAAAPQRLVFVCWIPFLTVIGLEVWMRRGWGQLSDPHVALYLVCSLLSILIYLPLVSWISLWVGLKFRTRSRAILTALGIIFAWCAAQIMVAVLVDHGSPNPVLLRAVAFMGPLLIVYWNESSTLFDRPSDLLDMSAWTFLIVNFLIYGGLLLIIRHLCLNRAEKYLRRS